MWQALRVRVDQIEKHSFVGDLLTQDSVVVDLGANFGNFAMEVIHRYGCRVLGVEPVPELAARIPKHRRFDLEEAAITGGAHHVDLSVNPEQCASIGIVREGAVAVRVAGITLAELLEKHGLDRIALLKVDIEGAEIPLFMSSADDVLLRADQITVEFHDFLDPELAQPVRLADRRLRMLGFQRLAFSLDNTDVLYVHRRHALSVVPTAAALARYKYGRGMLRRVKAMLNR